MAILEIGGGSVEAGVRPVMMVIVAVLERDKPGLEFRYLGRPYE
jgi:hypothetical protein